MPTRHRGRKRSGKSRKSNKGKKSMIKKVVRRQLQARGLNKPEVKHFYRYHPGVGVENDLSAVVPQYLNPIRQGDNGVVLNDYIYPGSTVGGIIEGNSYTSKFCNLIINCYNSDDTNPHWIRVIVVEDMQPTADDLIVYSTGAPLTNGQNMLLNDNMHSFYVPNNKRFKVLFDTTRLLPTPGTFNKNPTLIKKRINLHNARVTCIPTTNSEILQSTNREYALFYFSDNASYVSIDWQSHFGMSDV